MSDTAPRNPVNAPQMLADALLRSVAGSSAQLRITGAATDSNQSEVGLIATTFSQVMISPVVMRKLRATSKEGEASRWEMLASATSVQAQINALDLPSAQSLFAMTLAVSIGGQDYFIESVASNEAFGQVYLYRISLREACTQSL
jgi:tetrahydromethanopterin S-methyltransferase subunit E